MPVVFSATFPIRVNGNGTIDILSELRKDVEDYGCADIFAISERAHVSLEQAQDAARRLAGDGKFTCDEDTLYCCVDAERIDSFVGLMKRLRGE